jgi:hypothetical protein
MIGLIESAANAASANSVEHLLALTAVSRFLRNSSNFLLKESS